MAEREACITIPQGVFESFYEACMKAISEKNIAGMPILTGMVYELTDKDIAAVESSFIKGVRLFESLTSVMTLRRAFGDALSRPEHAWASVLSKPVPGGSKGVPAELHR
jgi:hypothetical protein